MTEKEYLISRIKNLEKELNDKSFSVKEKIKICRALAIYRSDLERVNSEQ